MATSDKISVAVRVRPLGEYGVGDVVVHDPPTSSLIIGVDRSFTFDHIFSPETDQSTIFDILVAPLITDCLMGINATVLAYGQTGSGKTYTMGTTYDISDFAMSDSVGIIPRAIVSLFDQIGNRTDSEFSVEAQFIELYNEELRDLLTPKKNAVKIQEKLGGGIYLSGATSVKIQCVSDDNSRVELISSKFHFVDLAGSERLGRTGAEGERAKEGIKINFGLLALGNVINALSENQKHVPYRDSKLTRLLCDSLGGNSRTVLIACISPAEVDMAESINTLQYATRAKKIRNTISINVANMTSADAETLKKLLAENRRLRQQLKAITSQSGTQSLYSRSPSHRMMSGKPSIPLRAKESLSQIAISFDKIMASRMKQMSEITNAGAARFLRIVELTNLKLQHAVLDGCGDSQAQQVLAQVRTLEKEIEDAASRVATLAEALRKSAAAIHDLLGKVERVIHAFPPNWQYIPQTIRSAMSTRLSNSDSAGLQCYNSNLINVLQLSQAEHARSLATILQLNQIAGPVLLRRYLPTLLGKASEGCKVRSEIFDDGKGIRQDGPSISSLLPGLFEGSAKRKPGLPRTAPPCSSTDSKRLGLKKPAPRGTALNSRPTASQQSKVVAPKPTRMSYVAAVGCNHVPEEYLTMLETAAPQATACHSSVDVIDPPGSPTPQPIAPRTVTRVVRDSPKFHLLSQVVPPPPSLDDGPSSPNRQASAPPVRHHQIPLSSRAQLIMPPTLFEVPPPNFNARLFLVVWHNGLPLPVVDSPEQENCPPSDVPMVDASKAPRLDRNLKSAPPLQSAAGGDVLRALPVQSTVTKRSISEVDADDTSSAADDARMETESGSCEEGVKRTKFTLRQSILERFQRCGIDFSSFAPP
ncbi:unnamed protein product [Mesocestoides corti]|uniref:Kinesin-like protein n=1 Tax=Mesocestoides corti TaxID=53468 RepID=A0A0R3UP76_MESCO|nr:unnamed protein product [Mesocestoides corti]